MSSVMPSYGMPSGASSGAPYFNGWSPYGGFAQPQQNYGGFGSPYGGFGSPFGSPYDGFGGFGGGYGQPFQQMPMGWGQGGYSSPFSQFQTPNFAAKGWGTQLQSPISPTGVNPAVPPGTASPQPYTQTLGAPLYSGNQIIGMSGGLGTGPATGTGTGVNPTPGTGSPQSNAPIPQAVPPQMMNPVSGPAQMGPGVQPTGILPQQTFNQNRLPGANPIFPKRNMLIGGYR